MRVIHCISSLGYGGIQRMVIDLVRHQKLRLDLIPSIGVMYNRLEGGMSGLMDTLGVEIYDFELNSGYDIRLIPYLRIYKKFRSNDVIHLHGFNIFIAILAVLSKRTIVYTEHGNFGFGRKNGLNDSINKWFKKLFLRLNVRVVCNSNFTLNYLNDNVVKPRFCCTVYNGIFEKSKTDKKLLKKLEEKYRDRFIIGTTSRLAGFKMVERLILLFADYIKINPKALLVIVGDGPKRKSLQSLVSKLNLDDYVNFEGFQSSVSTYQLAFDIGIFPSINEPFGLVALECYRQQKPVLVFEDGGGLTEVVGRFVPDDVCKDIDEMICRIEFYRSNKLIWNNDKVETLKYFNSSRMEAEYYEHYTVTKLDTKLQ